MIDESSSSSDQAEPVIELRDVGIWFRLQVRTSRSLRDMLLGRDRASAAQTRWALRGVDFTCREGETWGIVGHNGAGKSTLCLVLANILTPDEGQATVRGKVSALVTLGAGLNPELSGRENIQLYGAYLGIPRAVLDAKMDEIIDFSELGPFLDEPMRGYSTGMRARLGFSVATALEPEVLILDEVLSVGDPAFRAKSRARIEELMARSKCILMVSHSSSFLRQICTHCLWLDHGQVVMAGKAGEVLNAYDAATAEKTKNQAKTPR
ncbi:MAG: ABC transporter ATP-binding protein [Planctomycetota bacterium]|jgi:ABC-type polysaccharide/polyol phosphate transport system ATPase subunit